ncbi:unnamed protein product [Rotaria sp. Silwood1]|nr:unnamed protein product [Rotaria sp. Silwood1]
MKTQAKESGTNELQLLIDRTINLNDKDLHRQRQSSRYQWAEESWTRWFYIISLGWINPLLSLGYKTTLTEDDLDDLPRTNMSSTLYNMIKDSKWGQQTTFKIFLRALWKRCALVTSLLLPLMVVTIAQPLLIYRLILYIQDHQSFKTKSSASISSGYFYAIGLFVCALVQVLILQQYNFLTSRLDLMVRSLLLSTIYTRLLSINTATLRQLATNYVISIVTNDIAKFEEVFKTVFYIWQAPLVAVIIFGLLWWIIGLWPTLFSYITFILLIPLQMLLGRQFSRYRERIVTYTDQRVHAFEELINGCQTIKMYNWEKYIETRVSRMRELELASIRRASLLRAVNMALFFAAMPLVGFSTYAGAWFTGRQLKAVDIFITLAFYTQMRVPVMYALPLAIEKLSELRLAWHRIDKFIQLTIKEERTLHTSDSDRYQQKGAITMCNASFSWNGHDDCLSSLNIDIEPGTFVGIAGVVGAGKSSLFAAVLGEMIQTKGEININNSSFSYVAQTAWIFSDTLRANILFTKAYDEQRYMRVIRACCLDIDLTMLGPCGDLTLIGEKGVNLSGGQRVRVSLARALYADSDIYLLDDPLAALDRVVAKRIYDQCIGPNSLLRNKTRLLITHQTQFLTDTHQTIILAHGCIETQGRFDELRNKSEDIDDKHSKIEEDAPISLDMLDIGQSSDVTESIIVNEASENHNVSCSLWYSLFTAPPLGSFGFYLMIFFLVIGEILYDGTYFWLTRSSQQFENNHYNRFIGINSFFVLTMATLIVAVGRSSYFFYHILNGSNHFHNRMLSGLLYTSMRFFESNPSGRILNRVSKDQQVMDEVLSSTLFDAIQVLMMTTGSVITIIIINPWMILLLILLGPAFWLLCRYYLRSSQQLKRMESITRSPIFGLFASSLNGLTTIRAFKVQNDMIRAFMNLADANTRPYLYTVGAARWFCLRIDVMTTLFTLFTALFVVILRNRANPAMLTLSLLYSINISAWFQFGVRQLTEAQNLMISVERIDEYARLPQEEDNGSSKRLIKTPTDWPDRGAIEFRNYSLRYRSNLEPTLKNINLAIKPCEKVGIIGRTGAGKSSLFQGLLRLVDRSIVDGEILIDDIDISRITLNHLRSHISVIPQQFVLFAGTLRSNIDPLDVYSDAQCWTALEAVQMKAMASNHPAGLLMPVTESGSNLSIGQCQLICLCRAILRPSRILLIDEATANIDNESDRKLQLIIADVAKNRTVLTIAHRLNTVTNSDRLLALDNGMVVDFDVPDKVLVRFQ